jgi:hypothetical protein
MYTCNISNNTANIPNGYVIGTDVGGVDVFGNVFANNINFGNPSLGVHSFPVNPRSIFANNYSFSASGVQFSVTNASQTSKSTTGNFAELTVTTAAQAVTYLSLSADTVTLSQTGAGSLGTITGAPEGTEITIKFNGIGITIVNSTSMRLSGGVDAVSTSGNDAITLVSFENVFIEKCRNF